MNRSELAHPMQGLLRCPYHPGGAALLAAAGGAGGAEDGLLRCPECAREYPIEDGIYRLMPDEFRGRSSTLEPAGDAATAQKRREMEQRDARANGTRGGYVPQPAGSALEWMNVQYDAVTRRVRLPTSGVCVDFGTGAGRYMPWLLERVDRVVGTDFSFASLRRLREVLTPAQRSRCLLVQTDISRLGLAQNIASGGLCVEVLQHLPTAPMREAALREMGRVLQPGADLFLVTKALTGISRLIGGLQVARWWVQRAGARQPARPPVDKETIDGAIYTYRYTYGELRRRVRSYFVDVEARGIIAYGMFPITLLPPAARYRVDAWMEGSPVSHLFGQDMLFHLQRRASGGPTG